MRKLRLQLPRRFIITLTLVCSISISAFGGIFKVEASTISPRAQSRDNDQSIASHKNKTYNDVDKAWTYVGRWSKSNVRHTYGGQIHISNALEDYATISITGTRFTLIYSVAREYGTLDILVDDQRVDTINQRKSRTSHQKEWTSPELAYGTHVLKFIHADGQKFNIDAIKIRGARPNSEPEPANDPIITETPIVIPVEILNPTASSIPAEPAILTEAPTVTQTETVNPPQSLVSTEPPTLTIAPSETNAVALEQPTLTFSPSPASSPDSSEVLVSEVTSTPSLAPSPTASATNIPTNTPTITSSSTPLAIATSSPTPAEIVAQTRLLHLPWLLAQWQVPHQSAVSRQQQLPHPLRLLSKPKERRPTMWLRLVLT